MMAPTCLQQAGYCRKRGIYPQQITAWRRACESAADWASERGRQQAVLSAQAGVDRDARKKVRALERELQRKEKALAETTALLTLSKKALPEAGRPGDLGVGQGRMISTPDRRLAVSLIDEVRTAGA